MKTLSLVALLAAAVIVTACSAGASGRIEKAEPDDKTVVEYQSLQIRSRLAIDALRQRFVGDLLQVSVDLRNEWHAQLDFQYQFRFFDKDGFEVGSEGRPWVPIIITGKNSATVQATAPNPSAVSFKIVVRD